MRTIVNPPEIAKPASSYHHAVVISAPNRLLRAAGQMGERPDGSLSSDFREQAEQAWTNIEAILAAADMTVSDLTKVTSYLTNRGDIATYVAVHRQRVGPYLPPWTLVLVAGLGKPEYLVEVDIEAMR
ncbi:MAG TPA: RidA family protein [Steroidobacteraceae bacterium]|nr:RidA family protein [Steroidobacteraceae bacterium]